jgi:predicted aspartyl protease
MKLYLSFFFYFLFSTLAFAQQSSNPHWNAYHNVNVDYFFDQTNESSSSPLFRALASKISGQTDSVAIYLKKYLQQETISLDQRYAYNMLYDIMVQGRQYQAAVKLVREQKLDRPDTAYLPFRQQLPPPVFEGKGSTTVPFDGFYIDARIGEDSVRIFLDTGAPGLTVDAAYAEKYGWPMDTANTGNIVEPYVGIEYKVMPTLIHQLSIGAFKFKNIPASAFVFTEEMWKKKTDFGIKRYAIIMGLDLFYDMIDGVELDYASGKLNLHAQLPEKESKPNFMRVEGKPAIQFKLGERPFPAFIDSGSPRHSFTREMIAVSDTLSSYQDNYGSYVYSVYKLKLPELLGQNDIKLEVTGNARRVTSDPFNIAAHFGSFQAYRLYYDLRNRRVSLLAP